VITRKELLSDALRHYDNAVAKAWRDFERDMERIRKVKPRRARK